MPYKAVLMIGPNCAIPDDIEALCKVHPDDYLIIGDGKTELESLDSTSLKNINQHTKIIINGHGLALDNDHFIDGVSTKRLLKEIASFAGNTPLQIHIISCFAGAAANAIEALPNGSVLVLHGSDRPTLRDVGTHMMSELYKSPYKLNPVVDYINQFLLYVKQDSTITIKYSDDDIFKFTTRSPRAILSNTDDILKFFSACLSELVEQYNLKNPESLLTLPRLTEEEAVTWKKEHFMYLVSTEDHHMMVALKSNPEKFQDCINYQIPSTGNSCLLIAAEEQNEDMLELLLQSGADVNVQCNVGLTVLHCLIKKGNITLEEKILTVPNINVNLAEKTKNRTALHFACLFQKLDNDMISPLLAMPNIDVNARDKDGSTPLYLALENENPYVVDTLLRDTRVNCNIQNQANKQTVLHLLVIKGWDRYVQEVLPRCDLGIQNINGQTPLHLAALKDDYDILQLLLSVSPIDLSIKDNKGMTAIDLVAERAKKNPGSAMYPSQSALMLTKMLEIQKSAGLQLPTNGASVSRLQ